ncbi:unnamed protein product [Protopolystoma xenopodis]|uniref:Ubinuclein middle domain-containing protein n=1 Tax=Protopolystoma xenopodis TaxID=117903 RepID=A0A3S5BYF7_9PLAT|nr:unnamed protein product [Protopolystoma xenopodis]
MSITHFRFSNMAAIICRCPARWPTPRAPVRYPRSNRPSLPRDSLHDIDQHEQHKLEDIAKSFEKKYGTIITVNKKGNKNRVRIDDFVDPGDGYDSQDSFIDDSDAADIYVAPNVTTRIGGFYVHEGPLEGLEDNEAIIEPPSGKKIKLTESSIPKQHLKRDKSKQLIEKAVKCLSSAKKAPDESKRRCIDSASTGSEMTILIDDDAAESSASVNRSKETISDISTSDTPKSKSAEFIDPEDAPLPVRLPDIVLTSVKDLIKNYQHGGVTRRIYGKEFDVRILKLEEYIVQNSLTKLTRSAIYRHLTAMLHFKQKYLFRRLRKLKESSDESKMAPLLVALKSAVEEAVSPLLEAYSRDMLLHQDRLKLWITE